MHSPWTQSALAQWLFSVQDCVLLSLQLLSQPSPSTRLPSSQTSPGSRTLSPQKPTHLPVTHLLPPHWLSFVQVTQVPLTQRTVEHSF